MLDRRQDTTGRVKLVGNTIAEAEVSNTRNPKDPLKKEIETLISLDIFVFLKKIHLN